MFWWVYCSLLGPKRCVCVCFTFWLCHSVCGIIVPWPGIGPASFALEVRRLNHWTTMEVPKRCLITKLSLLVFAHFRGVNLFLLLFQAVDGLWQPARKMPEIWAPHHKGAVCSCYASDLNFSSGTAGLSSWFSPPPWELGYSGLAT